MRTVLLASATTLIAIPTAAQQWTPQQTEVVDQLKECWDVWESALEAGDPGPWLDTCATDDLTYWRGGSLGGVGNERGSWETWMQLEYRWVDLQPVAVKVHGDMAVIQFYGYWSERRGDRRVITEAKRTEVFERVGGRWRLSVGHMETTPFVEGPS